MMMIEVQHHGIQFESWFRGAFFSGYIGSQSQKWDIPAQRNNSPLMPRNLRNLDISVKTCKWKSPIGLGDVLRQRSIDTDFLMIVGFWQQKSETEKNIVEIAVVKFLANDWNRLWGSLDLDSLRAIDTRIKDLGTTYQEARAVATTWKRSPEVKTCRLTINPKIDSRKQRRIQCSFPFRLFWNRVGREPNLSDSPLLFGQQFPNPILASPRKFD